MKANYFLITFIFILCIGMGGDDKRHFSSSDEPVFAPLGEKEGCFEATIHDEKAIIKVSDFSFFGSTKLDGIRKDTDDSVNILDIANIRNIRIITPLITSTRHKDKEFVRIGVKTHETGSSEQEFLVPKNVVICGIERDSKVKKAWFLRLANQIEINKEAGFDKKAFMKQAISKQTEERLEKEVAYKPQTQNSEKSIFDYIFNIIDSLIDLIKAVILKILKLFNIIGS